jgi:4-amino-4-deoxy-L-arabinose transferase-like glycosyltransferase
MSSELASAAVIAPRRRPLGFELALAVLVSLAVLVPGIWSYSLVDPWETHYGEVARMMLQNHDWVHTEWPQENEGFRSKPVLQFWMMAASLRAHGVAADGGYSGEMVHSPITMVAIRLPFLLAAIAGLTLMWWMLARLVNRRVAWLALLVVGSCPIFCLIARQAIPDMPMVACVIGALALFVLAVEDGDRPIAPRRGPLGATWDARHVVLGLAGGFVAIQAIYYAVYFTLSPQLALRTLAHPNVWLPLMMAAMLAAIHRDGWRLVRWPLLVLGGVIVAALGRRVPEPPPRRPGQSRWRHLLDDVLAPWDAHAPDRYVLRALATPPTWLVRYALGQPAGLGAAWRAAGAVVDRGYAMAPITTMRQVFLIGCYALLGVSVLAKGPPGLAVVGIVGVLHLVFMNRWRALWEGAFELKRGVLVLVATFLPWHLAMFLKDGIKFLDEYLFFHILNRAGAGVDNSPGTFEYYTSQLGPGMWLWAALLPAAVTAALVRARTDTREGRVRFLITLWAIGAVALFSLVQTKFHHYILPAVPALGILVAFFLDDVAARRDRLHPAFAAIGAAIVLLVCRDLMFEPERWIEMFVYRYDRPWPSGEPWSIDPSDGFLALGLVGAAAIAVAATRWRRLGVACLGAAGLAIGLWSLHVYMPLAGKHWGMREAIRTYYDQRTIYGQKLIYFGLGELADDWRDVKDRWTFETHVPENLHVGQPMTLGFQVNRATDERISEQSFELVGTVSAIGDHSVEVTLPAAERARLDPLIQVGGPRGRPPVKIVDADRLIAWQLYWRGENFWSGDEIWGYLPELKTAYKNTDNTELTKYLNDRARTPLGRRYFVVTEAGRIQGMKSLVPTQRARDTYEVLDTTSNKFSLSAFWM